MLGNGQRSGTPYRFQPHQLSAGGSIMPIATFYLKKWLLQSFAAAIFCFA